MKAPKQVGNSPNCTVTMLEVMFVMPPPMPVTFSGKAPAWRLAEAVSARTVVEGKPLEAGMTLTGLGKKLAVTPAGRLLTERVTLLEKPSSELRSTRR